MTLETPNRANNLAALIAARLERRPARKIPQPRVRATNSLASTRASHHDTERYSHKHFYHDCKIALEPPPRLVSDTGVARPKGTGRRGPPTTQGVVARRRLLPRLRQAKGHPQERHRGAGQRGGAYRLC